MDQSDNRSAVFVRRLVCLRFIFLGFGEVDLRVGKLLEHRVGRLPFNLPVVLVDRFLNLLLRSESCLDFAVQNEPKFFNRFDIEWVGDKHLDRFILVRDWDDLVFTGNGFWHQLDYVIRDPNSRKVDVLELIKLAIA